MQLEDRKNEFPKMPMEIRMMIKKEVEKQMHNNVVVPIKRKALPKRKVIAAILAASLTLGTTVFAAVQYYKMTVEKVGEYGAETRIDLMEEETEKKGIVIDNETDGLSPVEKAMVEVPEVVCEVGYVPEGMAFLFFAFGFICLRNAIETKGGSTAAGEELLFFATASTSLMGAFRMWQSVR